MMCVAAMSAKAQVLTSKTINNVYEAVNNQTNSDYAFNAEWTGKDITTMYVYKKDSSHNGWLPLFFFLAFLLFLFLRRHDGDAAIGGV